MGNMRARNCIGWILAAALMGGCSSEPASPHQGKPVVVINDLNLMKEDLRQEIGRSPVGPGQASPEGEPEWLTRVIERELIIQEGRRLGLDRNLEFMRSIERFWKEALLKQVVQRKAREISSQVQVYEPEIEAYYQNWVKAQKGGALSSLEAKRPEIEQILRRQKEADAMEQWVTELREHAAIQVDRQALGKLQ